MKIVTFGSCLSRYTADTFIDMFGGSLVSCSHHNRIDRFVKTYLKKTMPELPYEYIESLNLSESNMQYIKNQYSGIGLGKHLLSDGLDFFDSVQGADIIITDNFVDLCSKLQYSHSYPSSPLFFNSKNDRTADDIFYLEKDYLPVSDAIKNWEYFGHYLYKVAPSARVFFINFPYDHSPNAEISKRSRHFSENFISTKFDIIPNINVPIRYKLKHTNSHFADDYYAMIAGILNFRLMGLNLTTSVK
ncbi:hypothetical protein [Psychrobacter sp. BI730]|uniref:hypothetical protein n=1 Tax=Psychrobacter sp. BI730 TaxID=2705463 RepID=UPI0015CA2104|nr:hypothetical protein [Psychrobacter sp. BI730]NYR09305.1 hypothetical protein [Psychrobacter sp. BI730]